MENTLFDDYEEELIICGTDEAGRGPLAGPVVAAAVVLPPDFPIQLLRDSKKLSEKRRVEAEAVIKEKAIWAVAAVSHKAIDRLNILNASLLAMKLAYEKIKDKTRIDMLLADGNKIPAVNIPARAIVKGDDRIPEIMAASILAKNTRDRLMDLADRKWPEYGYSRHKGYPTPDHIEAIRIYGPSPIQRMTFRTGLERDSTPDLFTPEA